MWFGLRTYSCAAQPYSDMVQPINVVQSLNVVFHQAVPCVALAVKKSQVKRDRHAGSTDHH